MGGGLISGLLWKACLSLFASLKSAAEMIE